MNYGVIQMNKGNLRVADDYFERALQFTPDYAFLHVNIAVLKAALGQPAEAERHFREALHDDPGNPVSYTFFARWLKSMGRTEEARLLADARSIQPGRRRRASAAGWVDGSGEDGPAKAGRPLERYLWGPHRWVRRTVAAIGGRGGR